ncbi:MAG: MFS transporter [Candidatus Aquilonibacter sp.]
MTTVIAPAPARKHAFGFTFVTPLALGSALNPINSTMIATALVPIATSLHVSAAEAAWLIAALYLASAIAQPTMGRLADLFGPRRVYLCALVLVALAGVIGFVANSLSGLVVARVILGVGTSGAYPSAMRIFRVRADSIGAEPPRAAMSFLSLAALSTMAIGPLLGGLLTGAFGWHAIFTVNVPLALLTFVLGLLWTPKDPQRTFDIATMARKLDLTGLALFSATLFGLMMFLMRLSAPLWWVLAASIALGALLVAHSRRADNAFFDVHMLAHNTPLIVTYLRACALATILYCMLYGFAQWLEGGQGLSASVAGLVTLPMSLAAAGSSFLGGRTQGIRLPFIASMALMVVGCIALGVVSGGASPWILAAAATLVGLPQGMFSVSTQAAVYIQAPPKEIGAAAGLQRTAFYFGAIIAASALGLLYGQHASSNGFLHLTIVMGTLSALLLIFTIFDRTLPRGRV